jgi:hypothetical protein
MRRPVVAAPALVVALLAACGPRTEWVRPGASPPEVQRDQTECAAAADRSRLVPRRRMDPAGRGDVIQLEEERQFSVAGYEACLRARGYRPVRVP